MSLVACPEGCGQKISTTAKSCPSCGYDIQQFLRSELTQRAVGFSLAPLDYWSSHFWYYSGCRHASIDRAALGWVDFHAPLMTLRYDNGNGNPKSCVIHSPAEGLIVRNNARLRTLPNVGYPPCYKVSPVNHEFIVMRPRRRYVVDEGKPFEPVTWCNGYSYERLTNAIAVAITGETFVSQLLNEVFDRGFRRFDPKQFFKSKEELLKAADELSQTYAIWLPDWPFESNTYEFGD